MLTPTSTAKSLNSLKKQISTTIKLWRKHHITYNQARYVAKEVRKALGIERLKRHKCIVNVSLAGRPV